MIENISLKNKYTFIFLELLILDLGFIVKGEVGFGDRTIILQHI